MASVIPKQAKLDITDAYAAETWYCALMKSTFAYAPTMQTYTDAIVGSKECTGSGYTAKGKTIGTRTSAVSGTENAKITATGSPTTSWTGASISDISYALVYVYDAATPANEKIRGIYELTGGPFSVSAGTFTLTWNAANGMLTVTSV
jgi:hypothetical protein